MDCEVMRSIATFPPLITLLFALVTISVIAVPLVLFVVIRISRNSLYHINTRVLLVAHGIGLIVHLTDRIFYHSWDLYRFLIILPEGSPCDIISTNERCFSIRLLFNCAMWFCVSTTPAIALERYIATKKISSYQRDRSNWITCLIFQVVTASCLLGLIYSKQTFGGFNYYCMAARSDIPLHVLTAMVLTFFLQLIAVLTFKNLQRANLKLKTSLQNNGSALTNRYQVEESLRALDTLSQPVHIMFASQFSYSIIGFSILYFNSNFSRPVYFFLMESSIMLPEYSIAFVLTFIRNENRVSKQSTKNTKKTIDVDVQAYFDHYKRAWEI